MKFTTGLIALATASALAAGGTAVHGAQASKAGIGTGTPALPQRVYIKSVANQQFVGVQSDGTLAPWSGGVGLAEQFDLYDLGRGSMALRSAAIGKYVTARRGQPLEATGDSIGEEAAFRRVSGPGSSVRLRAVNARSFVCAEDGGAGPLSAAYHCPHDWQLLQIEPVQLSELAITAPGPGSTLASRTVTFEWTGLGEEFWLTIGSVAGSADVYQSGPLGPETQHTVADLPLNGMTLYVQLHRRVGAVTDVVTAQYVAPIRKGLAVITDFADRRMEDWTGGGFKTADDLSVQLRAMEAHWGWLSRGLERIRWDIIRVTLTQSCVADAFSGWTDFRATVAALVRQQVAVADYDVNGDGTIDAAWLVVSAGGTTPETGCAADIHPWALGGSSANGGVAMFVDGQASGSVIAGATGNFNHELGHLVGLVDMYGTYDTLHGLTLMSDSWPVPPQDLAAHERIALGWVKPQELSETSRGVWLPSAHDTFAAVKVRTVRPEEYFLIEYRKRPASGYGSVNPDFNGLAVYHVLEGSSMWQDPPIVKLEPGDGTPGLGALDPADFLFPGHPGLPMVLRSYYGNGSEILRIENVSWRDDGLAFDVVVAAAPESANLLVNPSFEAGTGGAPDGWTTGAWVSGSAFIWPSPVASSGERSAMLESLSPNDIWWSQTVSTLVPGDTYKLCGSLKGEEITSGGGGGNVSLLGGWIGSPGLVGTFDWTRSCVTFVAVTSSADIACRLGFYAGTVSGRLWCDDLALERLRSAF